MQTERKPQPVLYSPPDWIMNSRILKHPPLGRARVQRAVQYYLPTSAGVLHVTLEKWGTGLSMDVEAQTTLPIAKRQRVNVRN